MPELLAYFEHTCIRDQDAVNVMVPSTFQWKDGIISKLRLMRLQEQ